MKVDEITKLFIDYLQDELVRLPTIEFDNRKCVIPRDLAIKYSNMYVDEVLTDLQKRGIEPIDNSELVEWVYALYDGGIAYLGKGIAGELYVEKLLPKNMLNNVIAMLHTHPIPIPIPTPEDIASAANLGYRIECIASRDYDGAIKVVCVSPKCNWHCLLKVSYSMTSSILSVEKFAVVKYGEGVVFLPIPTSRELEAIMNKFVEEASQLASVKVFNV